MNASLFRSEIKKEILDDALLENTTQYFIEKQGC